MSLHFEERELVPAGKQRSFGGNFRVLGEAENSSFPALPLLNSLKNRGGCVQPGKEEKPSTAPPNPPSPTKTGQPKSIPGPGRVQLTPDGRIDIFSAAALTPSLPAISA